MRNHLVALCLAALMLVVLASLGFAQTWPFFRGNVEGTGVAGVELTPPFALQWKYESGAAAPASGSMPAEMTSTPASDGKNVYFGSGNKVYACELESGAKLWDYTTDGLVQGALAVSGDLVLFGTAPSGVDTRAGIGGSVYAITASGGKVKWQMRRTEAGFRSSPVVAEGKVFIGSDDSNIYCLDLATGRVLWQQATGGCVLSAPSIDNDVLFVTSTSGQLQCMKIDDGQPLWSTGLASRKAVSSPCIGAKYVFIGAGQTMSAFSKRSGGLLWSVPTKDIVACTAAVADGVVYFGDESGELYAVTEAAGDPVWKIDVKTKIESSPAILGKYLLVRGAHGVVVMVDRVKAETELMRGESRLVWSYRTSPSYYELVGYATLAGMGSQFMGSSGLGFGAGPMGSSGFGGNIATGVLNAGGAGAGPGNMQASNWRQGNVETLTGASGSSLEQRGQRAGALAGQGAFGGMFGQSWGTGAMGVQGGLQGLTGAGAPMGGMPGGMGAPGMGGMGMAGGMSGGMGMAGGMGTGSTVPARLTLEEEILLRRTIDGQNSAVVRASLISSGQDPDNTLQSVSFTKHVRPSVVVASGMILVWGDDGALYSLKPNYVDNEAPTIVAPQLAIATANPEYIATYMVPDPTPQQQLVGIAAKLAPLPGRPPLMLSAVVFDEGSGINASALRVSLDGKPYDDFKWDPQTREVQITYEPKETLEALADGSHTFSVVASDWAGNLARKDWTFQIDNSVSPPEGPAVSTTGMGGMSGGMGMPGGMGGMGGTGGGAAGGRAGFRMGSGMR